MKNEKGTSKRNPVRSATTKQVGAGETGETVSTGSGSDAGAGHGAAASSLSAPASGDPDLKPGLTDTNPDFPQGDFVPIPSALPQPFTVPQVPWQMPPGSAIPI